MKCIVCLGNPGKKYRYTRHNIGFLAAEEILRRHEPTVEQQNSIMDLLSFSLQNEKILLLIPLTYMNNSGLAVRLVQESYDIRNEDFLIVFDDFQIPFGTLRFRSKGNDGGHNGIGSIIYQLETEEVPRLRIGVGSVGIPEKHTHEAMASYVLSNFTDDEMKSLPLLLPHAEKGIMAWLQFGISKAMSSFNKNFFHDASAL